MSVFEDIWRNMGVGKVWDHTGAGMLWKPVKKATGLTDAQMIGLGALAVAAPYALPAMGASGAAGGAGASGGASGLSFAGGTTGAPALGAGTSTGLATGVDMAGTGVGSTGAGVGSSGAGGLLTMDNASKGMTMAQQAGLLDQQQQQPMQAGQVGLQGPDFSGLLAASSQLDAQRLAEEEKRKQQQQVIVQGILGGAYGR